MPGARPRFVIAEASDAQGLTQAVAEASDVSQETVLRQVSDLNDRLKKTLGLEASPLEVSAAGTWRIDGVAGVLKLNNAVELEVVPKFLAGEENWRQDFFFIIILVRTGRLLLHEELAAGTEDRGDLATLVARALLRGHVRNGRRPIRNYRNRKAREFSFDGDVEWDSLAPPSPDGFEIHRLELTAENQFNAVLRLALVTLLPQIGESDTRALASRVIEGLPSGLTPPRHPRELPPRHAPWRETYELSCLVLEGLGLDLAGGSYSGPGFVLPTWLAWQQLCDEVLMRALREFRGAPQHAFVLGTRSRGEVSVRPDLTLFQGEAPAFLFDAKYKSRIGRRETVSNADLYESLAFMRASGCNRTFLVYPSTADQSSEPIGTLRQFDNVEIGAQSIGAVTLQTRGIARRGGFGALVEQLRAESASMLGILAE